MKSRPDAKQGEHAVADRREVAPQIEQAIAPWCDLLLQLLLGERVKELLGSIGVGLPRAKCCIDELLFYNHWKFWWIVRAECSERDLA